MSKNANIHPTAIIEPGAQIGNHVTIEAYAIIKENVILDDGVVIKSHAYIDGHTTIGEGTTVWPSASIGTRTQNLKFKGEKTFVQIGKNCQIREFVTINSSWQEGTVVKVGDNCLIMAYCHVAHTCELGDHVILANGVNLAGHVTIGERANVGGMTAIHQHCRIGAHAMIGGFSRITHDVPPYTIGGGIPYKLGGLNLVGLKRNGINIDVRKGLSQAFRLTYRSKLHVEEAIKTIETNVPHSSQIAHWIDFCRSSKRGLIGFQGLNEPSETPNHEELLEEV